MWVGGEPHNDARECDAKPLREPRAADSSRFLNQKTVSRSEKGILPAPCRSLWVWKDGTLFNTRRFRTLATVSRKSAADAVGLIMVPGRTKLTGPIRQRRCGSLMTFTLVQRARRFGSPLHKRALSCADSPFPDILVRVKAYSRQQ